MNTKLVLNIFIFYLCINCLHGQTINYTYDENGNRTTRVLIVEQQKSKGLNVPVEKLKDIPVEVPKEDLKETETKTEKEAVGELKTLVYPNPSKGLIKIDIVNLPLDSRTEARLYDLSGTELIVKKNFDNYYEMDINKLKDGIYILRIVINDVATDWKIIKNAN
jgi:hypothetical protein